MKFIVLTITLIMLLQLGIPSAFADVTPLTVIYSGNLDGELEPCGCSDEGNLGGIKRRATSIDNVKEQNPNSVIISAGGLIASEGTNDYLKAVYIFKAFADLGYDAIGVQWNDLNYGAEMATQNNLPWVASNWLTDEFAKSKTISRTLNDGKVAIRFFSWLDPDSSPIRQMPGGEAVTYDDI